MSNRSIVTMITWNRLDLTKQTIRSFVKHNGMEQKILVVDNGSNDGTVKWLRKHGHEVIRNKTNLGIFMATRIAWIESFNRGYDYILNLQNDFPCVRPVEFDVIEKYMDTNLDVGFIQLNDKGILLYPRSDGTFKIKKKPRKNNYITGDPLKFTKWESFDGLNFCKGNNHFSFNPNFFRSSLVMQIVGDVEKPRERQIMEKFEMAGLKSARIKDRCFETIIRKRQDAWIH